MAESIEHVDGSRGSLVIGQSGDQSVSSDHKKQNLIARLIQAIAKRLFPEAKNPGPSVKRVASGADKVVWISAIPHPEPSEQAKAAYYTPNRAFGFSMEKNLRKEFKTVSEIQKSLGEQNVSADNLAVNWEEMEGEQQIKGKYTIKTDAASGDFEKAINNEKTSIETRLQYMEDLLTGLTSLHAVDYVHGDLKPENCLIILVEEGKSKLQVADFGRALHLTDDQSQPYKGNTRFAPPEGLSSKKGEVYSAAMMMIRTLEESLGSPLQVAIDPSDRDSTPHSSRRGLDAFVLKHKAFLACENKGSWLGRIENGKRRKQMKLPDPIREAAQSEALREYIDALGEALKKNNELSVKKNALSNGQIDALQDLLGNMVNANPKLRPTMLEALETYRKIIAAEF